MTQMVRSHCTRNILLLQGSDCDRRLLGFRGCGGGLHFTQEGRGEGREKGGRGLWGGSYRPSLVCLFSGSFNMLFSSRDLGAHCNATTGPSGAEGDVHGGGITPP